MPGAREGVDALEKGVCGCEVGVGWKGLEGGLEEEEEGLDEGVRVGRGRDPEERLS